MQSCAFFFFFQAEDGIRDPLVTGVQTCALPISRPRRVRVALLVAGVLVVVLAAGLGLGAVLGRGGKGGNGGGGAAGVAGSEATTGGSGQDAGGTGAAGSGAGGQAGSGGGSTGG